MQSEKGRISRVTLEDVAQLADVSRSTASMALRNSSSIAPLTRERVRKATEKLGYSTNFRNDGLRKIEEFSPKPRARNFGFVLAGEASTDPVYTIAFHATAREATRGDQHLFCYPLRAGDSETDTLTALKSSECGGFLLMGSVEDVHHDLLRKTGRPVVVLGDHRISTAVHHLTFNDFHASRGAVRHLAALGHRRIAFVSENLNFFHRQEWLRGYREEARALGFPLNPGMVQTRMKPTPHLEVIKPLFERKPSPTAVLVTSHGEGMDVVRHCKELGLRVPRDVSVMVLGGLRWDLHREPLTCMEPPLEQMGRLGLKRLRELAADPEEVPFTIVLNFQLRDHGSCSSARIEGS